MSFLSLPFSVRNALASVHLKWARFNRRNSHNTVHVTHEQRLSVMYPMLVVMSSFILGSDDPESEDADNNRAGIVNTCIHAAYNLAFPKKHRTVPYDKAAMIDFVCHLLTPSRAELIEAEVEHYLANPNVRVSATSLEEYPNVVRILVENSLFPSRDLTVNQIKVTLKGIYMT